MSGDSSQLMKEGSNRVSCLGVNGAVAVTPVKVLNLKLRTTDREAQCAFYTLQGISEV